MIANFLKIMSTVFGLGAAVWFYSPDAIADIEAQSSYVYDSSQSYIIAGSKVEGTFGEAFIDLLQFASAMYSALDGNPYAGYQAYQEFRQFIDAAGDKAAIGSGHFTLIQGKPPGLLRFSVNSDDDPIGTINVAYPNGGALGAAFTKQVLWQSGAKHPRIDMTINQNLLPVGEYPLVFYTKETKCNICLSITHKITLRVKPAPAVCHLVFPRQCTIADNKLSEINQAISNAQEDRRQTLARLQAEGPHAAIKRLKQRLENTCPHTADPEACIDRMITEFEGSCTNHAYGVRTSNNTVCSRLAQIDANLSALEFSRKQAEKEAASACICQQSGPID